jgi:flavorubredoxin
MFSVSAPHQIAPEAFVIPAHVQAPGAPVGVHLNSMVLRGAEPVVFDTSVPHVRDQWLEQVFSLVEPEDIRWVVLSHEDVDHAGNVEALLEAAPNATAVVSWFIDERLGHPFAPPRMRWVGPGETLDVGDRILSFVRPPLYDSPTTRVVADPVSGVLWAADLFATPVLTPTNDAEDLDPGFLAGGFAQFQQWNSPWVHLLDRARYDAEVEKLAAVGATTIASTHGPAFCGSGMVERAFELLRRVPDETVDEQPGQPVLDEIVAGLAGGTPG